MMWLGDVIVLFFAIATLIYGLTTFFKFKKKLYFQVILGAVICHILGTVFDVCELIINGALTEGFTIGYLGTIGCFLFLLTASCSYMDGILDDRTTNMRKSRIIALIAPVIVVLMLVPNWMASVPLGTKISYTLIWIPATFSSYFNLKHLILPDMGFGFVKAIRPFNVAALVFTEFQLIHLTVWNFGGWISTIISGAFLGVSCFMMMAMAKKGVSKWIL